MNEAYFDGHTHPTAWSFDGIMSPWEPPQFWYQVKREFLDNRPLAVAMTDHDTTVGIEPVLFELDQYNRREAIPMDDQVEPICGVEATGQFEGFSTHILGYWLQKDNETLQALMPYMQQAQDILFHTNQASKRKYGYFGLNLVKEWAKGQGFPNWDDISLEMLERLRDGQLPHIRNQYSLDRWVIGPYEDHQPRITGLNWMHLAMAMAELEWCSLEEAKSKVKRGGELYVSKAQPFRVPSTAEVIFGLYTSRCLVVMAHPQELMCQMIEDRLAGEGLDRLPENDVGDSIVEEVIGLIAKFIEEGVPNGLRGLELYNRFSYRDTVCEYMTQRLEKLVADFNGPTDAPLLVTAGSDNHDGIKDEKRQLARLLRQKPDVYQGPWIHRNSWHERPNASTLEQRIERRRIDASFLKKMKAAPLQDDGLYPLSY